MKNVFLAGAAAISLTILPTVAIAQASGATAENSASSSAMTAEQKALYDAWPADRKADYDTWNAAQKSYYWGLDSEKRNGYWALTPEQRSQIQGLTPAQQTEAWASIASQLSGQAATPVPAEPPAMNPDEETGAMPPAGTSAPYAPAPTSMMPGSSGNTQYTSNVTVQGGLTTPTPKAEYPVCKGDVQDSCTNRGGK